MSPHEFASVVSTSISRGKAGEPKGAGWSRTVHYEASSKARVNHQCHNDYTTTDGGDAHRVVAILTIELGQPLTGCSALPNSGAAPLIGGLSAVPHAGNGA